MEGKINTDNYSRTESSDSRREREEREFRRKKRIRTAKIGGGVGLGTGIAGTVGVAEYGKRRAEKQQAYVPQQEEHSPLDPNY